jgi:class 3 adenylate cyclase
MSTTATVTVMFTDVVDSTQLRTGRGEALAHRDLQNHSGLVRQQVEAHGGRVAKTAGDDFMVAFESARRAVECAVAIQRELAEQNRRHPDRAVHIRIGINTGEAMVEGEDLFGAAVNAAKRIESKAAGDQILVSEIVRGVVGAFRDVEFVDRGRVRLKGFPERWRLYEVPWQAEAAAPEAVMLTFMFTDIAGSTEIAERLGDELWLDIVRAHNAIFRAELAAHEASWSKSLGDGFMAAFPTAVDGVKCAISLQRDFVEYNDEHPEEPLLVQVGLHTGKAVKEADDYFSTAVNLAARITRQARAGGILVSQTLKELTEGTREFAFDEGREVKLTGVPEPVRVYEVSWHDIG